MNNLTVIVTLLSGLIFVSTAVTEIEVQHQDAVNFVDNGHDYLPVILLLTQKLIYCEDNVTSIEHALVEKNDELENAQVEHKKKEKQWISAMNASALELERMREKLKEQKENCTIEKSKIEKKCPVKVLQEPNANGYNYSFGDSLYKLYPNAVAWNDARKACMQDGAYLGIVNSDEEFNIFIRMVADATGNIISGVTNYEAWIGVHDHYRKDEWVTIYGETLDQAGFSRWGENEPNDPEHPVHCAGVQNLGAGGLFDSDCISSYAYICEMYNGK